MFRVFPEVTLLYLQPLLRRFLFVEANIKAFFKLGKFAYVFFSAPPHVWRMAYTRHEAGIRAFGQRLRQLRKEKGLSQEALAFAADIELSQISRMERGIINTSISQVFQIAQALGVSPAALFEFHLEA